MSGVATAIAGAAVVGAVASNKASKKQAEATGKASDASIAATERAVKQARGDLERLFPQAQQSLLQGYQGAADIFGQSLPAQTQAFQQGNLAAQQHILAGMPQMQNAILGGPVDYSAFQATAINPGDLSFFQQQLPQQQTIGETPNQQQAAPTNPNYGFGGSFGTRFDFSNTLGGVSNYIPSGPGQRLK
jgi:hypothetical protein